MERGLNSNNEKKLDPPSLSEIHITNLANEQINCCKIINIKTKSRLFGVTRTHVCEIGMYDTFTPILMSY